MSQKNTKPIGRTKQKPAASLFSRHRLATAILIIFPLVLTGIVGFSAMQFENHDSFCASCHTQPESVYFQRESANSPLDLASFHTEKETRCIDCHSAGGSTGRAAALMLGARDLMAFVSKHYAQPAPLTRAIQDDNCLKCHANLTQRQSFNNHFHILLSKWQALDPEAATCVDCHQSHATNGDASIGFLNRDIAAQVCERCHTFAQVRG